MEVFKIEVFRDEEIYYRKLGKLLYHGFFIVEKDKKFVITDEFFNVITKGMFDEIKPAFRYHFWGRMNIGSFTIWKTIPLATMLSNL